MIKTDIDKVLLVLPIKNFFSIYFAKLLLVLIMEKEIPKYFVKSNFFIIFETKCTIKQNFMYFGHKHVET